MATIEISSEEENRDYDDIHSDVDSVVSHNTVSSEEESSGEEAPVSISSFASRSGAEWKPIRADTVTSGRHAAANVLNPAPGLTAHAYQRIRDNPVLDAFHIIFSKGKKIILILFITDF